MIRSGVATTEVGSLSVLSLVSTSAAVATVPVLTIVPSTPEPGCTVSSMSAVAPGAIGSAVVHENTWPTVWQVHPSGASSLTQPRPVGSTSVTVVGPTVAWSPLLVTLSLYSELRLGRKLPVCDLSIARSIAWTSTVSASELSAVASSVSLAAWATTGVLVTCGTAAGPTSTLIVSAGALAPAAIDAARVHVTSWLTAPQVQPVPVKPL